MAPVAPQPDDDDEEANTKDVPASQVDHTDCVMFKPTSSFIIKWDLTISFVLIYTCFATPYELAFLETKIDAWFVINRICDVIFATDILINFNPILV